MGLFRRGVNAARRLTARGSRLIECDGFKLKLDARHPLPSYFKAFPLYDRFLPVLCQRLDGVAIDVGGNIGDTAAAILARNPRLRCVGAEPDPAFCADFAANIALNDMTERASVVPVAVSSAPKAISVQKNSAGSTGHAVEVADAEHNAVPVTEFLERAGVGPSTISVFKIDTDGYDWDVLDSLATAMQEMPDLRPRFVFFELQTCLEEMGPMDPGQAERLEKYRAAMHRIQDQGYDHFLVLDNFGTPILKTESIDIITQLADYVVRSRVRNNATTFYFVDVLAYPSGEEDFVDDAVARLLSQSADK